MSTIQQTAPLRLKARRASEGLMKNTSTTTTRFMTDYSDGVNPITASRTDMRTLIDMHKKRGVSGVGGGLPTLQQRTNNAAAASDASHSPDAQQPIVTSPQSTRTGAPPPPPPELSSLFSHMQQRERDQQQLAAAAAAKKVRTLHAYERNGSGGLAVASVAGSGMSAALGGGGSASGPQSAASSLAQALSSSSKSKQQVVNSGFASSSSSSSTHTSSHASSSSSSSQYHMSTSEMKPQALMRDLNNLKNSMSEMDSLASSATTNNTSTYSSLKKKLRASMENLIDGSDGPEQLVTFPDDDDDHHHQHHQLPASVAAGCSDIMLIPGAGVASGNGHGQICSLGAAAGAMVAADGTGTVKFEEKRTTSATKSKVITDGFSSEQATSNSSEMKHLQAGDVDYKEEMAAAAVRKKVEVDGVTAEQNAAAVQEARTFKSGDISQQESNNMSARHVKISSDTFSAQKTSTAQAQQRQTVTAGGVINQDQKYSTSSQAKFSMSASAGICTTAKINEMLDDLMPNFDDLKLLRSNNDVETALQKYSQILDLNVQSLQTAEQKVKVPNVLNSINEVLHNAWSVPTYGHQLGYGLCNTLRNSGGLDLLVGNCVANDQDLQFSSARLLEQCLTTENRSHVVDNGLEKVVSGACICTKGAKTIDHSRVGTGILEHLFKHSEGTCSNVIKLGGLNAVLFECRKNDVETLRHCAMALANLSLYGGTENQEEMIKLKVPMWLFPLAFHDDDNVKYYACLAIAVLVANKEIEAEVLKSGTLDLVEPFVTKHSPAEFAKSNLAHAHGQSKHWLARLVPVLSSNREEARNLAAFHFCMEAGIKKEQQKTSIFREIGAVEPLKIVASCPNPVASKFAAQALRLIGEEVPHKLSQQVPLWSVKDVREWVKQIGFDEYETNFSESRVDGDLLLQLNDDNIRDDIGMVNGIRRHRFRRELENLKKMADYSSRDTANLNAMLQAIGPEFSIYTYSMLNAGVDKESLKNINESQLINECGIVNSIHRLRILSSLKSESTLALASEASMEKTLDVFVSYRRSNGSQLASLLKVHLQLRGFTVFIDVERLEAGKFDNNLLNSIKQAKHFILVLTPNTLDRCIDDDECKDWVHREIVAAISSGCNIIPIIDNFQWPEAERLPRDIQDIPHFNGVRWIHDYQDACVDKLERFLRGEREAAAANNRPTGGAGGGGGGVGGVPPGTPNSYFANSRANPMAYQRMHSNESDLDGTALTNGPQSLGSGRCSD